MSSLLLPHLEERDACGVGFAADRHNRRRRYIVERGLTAMTAMEHRGACLSDRITGDGTGIMTEIPWDLFGVQPGEVCVATLFLRCAPERRGQALDLVAQTFAFFGLEILRRREVPTDDDVLGPIARELQPEIFHLIIKWPAFARRRRSLARILYLARQKVRTVLGRAGYHREVFFTSLSTSTIVYKALTRAGDLAAFYPDLREPAYKSRFALFHRRFSTNTRTSWDKAQPFRVLAHNGEINTIAGNRSWSYSREQALGLPPDELLTHAGISDSGSLNEMCEALKYRSGVPDLEDILAILIPPAVEQTSYYRFWSRAVEPWDGPALVAYSDGRSVGARLDRNGFRPCRWAQTEDAFYVASEAGVFDLEPSWVEAAGTLAAGNGVKVDLDSGEVHFRDPSESRENAGASFEPRLLQLPPLPAEDGALDEPQLRRFGLTREDVDLLLVPMVRDAKEPIGSMGDTAPLAVLSSQPRSFFDYFFQTFAQVTNPPLDYLRERMVTDLSTFVGKRPNIFQPKEMLPPMPGVLLDSPLLELGRLTALEHTREATGDLRRVKPHLVDITFARDEGARGLRDALERIEADTLTGIKAQARALILTDRAASKERLPVPSLLALRAVVQVLNREGLRLTSSIVVDAGDAWTSHHVAALIGFGATAVCPRLALQAARDLEVKALEGLSADERESRLLRALEAGLLKIMSKMGISVVRSYQSSKLFTAVGLSASIIERYFRGLSSPIGGVGLSHIAEQVLKRARDAEAAPDLVNLRLFREAKRGGEHHAMTAARAKLMHAATAFPDVDGAEARAAWDEYLEAGRAQEPIHVRHLVKPTGEPIPVERVEPRAEILRRFGSGAMSFGAISADTQRDLFRAMARVGGRSNSGEGGENPHYFVDGTTATTKQVASGRFGVTAEYLITGDEIEIKIAQGAKPGEGGQLMAKKVDEAIARARHASPGVDLISPPPLHDIYSIEDLKGLIYELKQLAPGTPVVVKLVSGVNIGTIAVGVAKAGADVVQVSGGDGGTGAATLTSMKHAGLPWELGLAEVHRALSANGLRAHLKLRADGGLCTGHDIVVAGMLGADEVGFGKLMLIGAGCIMARICEKNTCPRGIATHDPRFLKKYRGDVDEIVRMLELIAEDVRRELANVGAARFADIVGRADLLAVDPRHERLLIERDLDLSRLCQRPEASEVTEADPAEVGELNQRLAREVWPRLVAGDDVEIDLDVKTTDRGVLARLAGEIAARAAARRRAGEDDVIGLRPGQAKLRFRGSAGQGFGIFCQPGLDVELLGEANDSVCKSMSGGAVLIRPADDAGYRAEDCAIIGNSALYGATGGELFVYGHAGDRFAVRNSGATAVVEGVGMHGCGYMTGGLVVILGPASHNVGSGMTGGRLIGGAHLEENVSRDYLEPAPVEDKDELRALLARYLAATGSARAKAWLDDDLRGARLYRPRAR
jgi:glutamate synthase domain-containing protein 2/glutamate synthase domain-containing protein 1/glutamate synthase domain-containing protein 3